MWAQLWVQPRKTLLLGACVGVRMCFWLRLERETDWAGLYVTGSGEPWALDGCIIDLCCWRKSRTLQISLTFLFNFSTVCSYAEVPCPWRELLHQINYFSNSYSALSNTVCILSYQNTPACMVIVSCIIGSSVSLKWYRVLYFSWHCVRASFL